jgi:hypothetical protein
MLFVLGSVIAGAGRRAFFCLDALAGLIVAWTAGASRVPFAAPGSAVAVLISLVLGSVFETTERGHLRLGALFGSFAFGVVAIDASWYR